MLAKIKSRMIGLLFFARNINAARHVLEIKHEAFGDFMFRGYSSSDAESIAKIYQRLNGGAVFSRIKRKLYTRIGRRCLLVVEQRNAVGASKIVGMNMYYLTKRDVQENTIHEGFIGVLPEAEGQGIATKMRKMAVEHFKASGFSGISTRISLCNTASVSSARKIGFQSIEEYQDPLTGEQRYYMIIKF